MRFEVPQFIEIEDKIFGPFTWRQFIYLAGGGGLALILFFTLPLVLFAILGIPIIALSGFLAFHKINNRPFSLFLESLFNYFTNSRLYLWRKDEKGVITNDTLTKKAPIDELPPEVAPPIQNAGSGSGISSLSSKLELDSLEHNQQNGT